MKLKVLTSFVLIFCMWTASWAQEHFLVELENRSPDVQSLVKSYEGFPSIPFMANDMNGDEVSLMAMKGKTVILWFWNMQCPKCVDQMPALNNLHNKYRENLSIVSLADDSRETLSDFSIEHNIQFPVIPNSRTLSDGPYGGDLGYPKLFIIDAFGVVKWVIPEAEMKSNFDIFNFLETLHLSLQK